MDNVKLIKAREYYDRTTAGEDKQEVALELYGRKSVKKIEESDEYQMVVSAAAMVEKNELEQELEQAKKRQLKAFSTLLDKGEELMDEAETTDDKIKAQANQRANLATGVVSEAISWNGPDRNQNDMSDVLEGVILP